jgi:hypothetical protein
MKPFEKENYRALLKQLESGEFRIGEVGKDGRLIDRTERQIETIRRILADN